MSDHFFVVTGGPGAGKTSIITELACCGFHTVSESGRTIIREELQRGGDALPWADRLAYAERMLEQDLRAYSAAQALSGPVIFDRGIPDILGYLTLCGPCQSAANFAPLSASNNAPLVWHSLPGAA